MIARVSTISTVALVALLGSQIPSAVNAHGELVLPKPTYHQWGGNVCATVATNKLSVSNTAYGAEYPKAFDTAITAAGLSLKEFVLKNQDMSGASVAGSTPECGYSDPAGTPQPLPESINFNSGFIHQGPCEAYCDDVLVTKHTVDCRSAYPGGIVPYDKAKCAGKKRFTLYWLSMDSGNGAAWQVYTNCVPIAGAGNSSSPSSSPAVTPKPTTVQPSATTPSTTTPAKDADDEYDDTDAPAPAATEATDDEYPETNAPAPAATTKAPAPVPAPSATTKAPSSKCTRRARRN